ncbi:carbamoyl phosphate synthase large subunit [Metabacillus herbersteinensis]|uniref:Carbamoyl phosphate synthase large chain n=1 Tax=Metabacillus herbersteinensis TaxID=283816 RepID=A0ABV6GEA7_9BACI
MPKNNSIQKILVIGSGPIIIGQAAEFDYAGTQGCLALKEEGYKVILVNNNPATIMTDEEFSDELYFEPLTLESLTKIIKKERPQGLIASLGGQTALNLAVELHESGVLEEFQVSILGTSYESIQKGENREKFRQLMVELNEPIPDSSIVTSLDEALSFAEEIGFPVIVRPAYTLGGKGGGIAKSKQQFEKLVLGGLQASPIHQCLIEKSIAGFKEIEYEMIRDSNGTCIAICNMENIDPVGIHTGDSIVVAPSQTLTDQEYQMLRKAGYHIVSALGVEGGCNIQFALDPNSKQYYVIEVNPRVSRSSALASKATGYPIAKIATKIAVGYTLQELKNPLTLNTYASFEPSLDYVVVKFPRWPFDKFAGADRTLGTKMKATGEVMAIERNLEAALQKAVNSLELSNIGTYLPELDNFSTEQLWDLAVEPDDRRFFVVMELLRRNCTVEEIHQQTKIDRYFLASFQSILSLENQIKEGDLTDCLLKKLKEKGFSDQTIAYHLNIPEREIREKRQTLGIYARYKNVDTCAAEFEASTNYFYSTYFGENEQSTAKKESKRLLIIGSGPIRIGQGIEFDYSAVQAIKAVKKLGYEAIMINSNPETVSTDYEIADRLYFEPITLEHVLNIVESEKIDAVIVQFGGQTAINLANELEQSGVSLLGTDSTTLDFLEDRDKFYTLLDDLDITHAKGITAATKKEAITGAKTIGYPILLRPSYVIGGKGMVVAENESSLINILSTTDESNFPLLIDQFIAGSEGEIDLISDGFEVFIPTFIEHVEPSGVHSGDSLAIIPAINLQDHHKTIVKKYAELLVKKLSYKGMMNIQYLIHQDRLYILEVNPRASRTAPIVSKVTGIQLIQYATFLLCGKSLKDFNLSVEESNWIAVKYPVFSSHALHDVDLTLGPEMKATGEGMCIGTTYEEVLKKIYHLDFKQSLTVFFDIEEKEATRLSKESGLKVVELMSSKPDIVVSVLPGDQFKKLRQKTIENGQLLFTNLSTYYAFLKSIQPVDVKVNSIQQLRKKEVVQG